MQYSIVNYEVIKSESHSLRIDADFFHPYYLDILKKLKDKPFKKLADFKIKIQHPKEIKRKYSEKGVMFLRAQNVRPLRIDITNNTVYISEKDANILKNNLINEKDILLTRTGANFGQCAIFLEKRKAIASSHTFIIKSGELNPFFLAVFFNTIYGRKLIDKGKYGGLQPEVAPFFLYEIPLPIFGNIQNIIEKIYLNSQKNIEQANLLYSKAKQIFLSELGLKNWKPKHKLAFVKNYSDTKVPGRIDAEYFQPKFDEIVEIIKNYQGGFDTLGNLATIKKCIEVGSSEYLDEGIPFIRVSNISPFQIKNEKYISKELYNELKSHQPQKGEILLSKDATPGIAYFLHENSVKMIPSGGILRIKTKSTKIIPEYLSLVLNSLIVKEQIDRDVGGSVILHWRPDQVNNTLIPILEDSKQEIIMNKITESTDLRQKSKTLLEIAKKGVEIAIEKDEETAEKWIKNEVCKLGVKLDA